MYGASFQTTKAIAILEKVFKEDLSDEVVVVHRLERVEGLSHWENISERGALSGKALRQACSERQGWDSIK